MTDEDRLTRKPPGDATPRPVPLPIDDAGRPGGAGAKSLGAAVDSGRDRRCCAGGLRWRISHRPLDRGRAGARSFDDPAASEGPSLTMLRTPAPVWWSGEGCLRCGQRGASPATASGLSNETDSGDVRALKGDPVVGVELLAVCGSFPIGARPAYADFSDPTTSTLLDIAWDGVDTPPAALRPAAGLNRQPRADVDARWAQWDGPAGHTVSVEIDVKQGGVRLWSSVRHGPARASTPGRRRCRPTLRLSSRSGGRPRVATSPSSR